MRVVAENYEQTHTHTNTRDNYSNPRCAHARRGLIISVCADAHAHLKCVIVLLPDSQPDPLRSGQPASKPADQITTEHPSPL